MSFYSLVPTSQVPTCPEMLSGHIYPQNRRNLLEKEQAFVPTQIPRQKDPSSCFVHNWILEFSLLHGMETSLQLFSLSTACSSLVDSVLPLLPFRDLGFLAERNLTSISCCLGLQKNTCWKELFTLPCPLRKHTFIIKDCFWWLLWGRSCHVAAQELMILLPQPSAGWH